MLNTMPHFENLYIIIIYMLDKYVQNIRGINHVASIMNKKSYYTNT